MINLNTILIYILLILLTINIFLLGFYTAGYNIECENCSAYKCETCILYNPNVTRGVNGVYYSDNYYCVWTNSRTYEEIVTTENHEICHHLVYENYDHFCK